MASIRIPNLAPRVQENPQSAPRATAPQIVPQQDAGPQQMQQLSEGLMQFGSGMMRAGSGMMRAGDYLQDVHNDAKATTFKNEYREAASVLRNKAAVLEGVNAVEQLPGLRKELEALREGFSDRFENGAQERMFSEFADGMESSVRVDLDGMLRKQTFAANIGAQAAAAKGEALEYLVSLHDPEKAAGHKAAALLAVTKRGEMEGWDDKTLDLKLLAATNEMHAGALDGMAKQDPKGAQSYLDKNRQEMDPQVAARFQDTIRISNVRETSVAFMFQAERQAALRGGTLAEQEVYAQQIADASYKGKKLNADEYQAVTQQIASRFRQHRGADAQLTIDAMNEVEKFYADPGNTGKPLSSLDPTVVQRLVSAGKFDTAEKIARSSGDFAMMDTIEAMDLKAHQDMGDQEFALMVASLPASKRATAVNLRNYFVGSPEARAKAAISKDQDDEIAVAGRRILADQLSGHNSDEDKNLLAEFNVRIKHEWAAAVSAKEVRPNDSLGFTQWLRKREAHKVLARGGEEVNPLALPRDDAEALAQDPVVRYQGAAVPLSSLPAQIQVSNGGAAPETRSREDIAARLAKRLKRDPTPQELADTLQDLIGRTPAPARSAPNTMRERIPWIGLK